MGRLEVPSTSYPASCTSKYYSTNTTKGNDVLRFDENTDYGKNQKHNTGISAIAETGKNMISNPLGFIEEQYGNIKDISGMSMVSGGKSIDQRTAIRNVNSHGMIDTQMNRLPFHNIKTDLSIKRFIPFPSCSSLR